MKRVVVTGLGIVSPIGNNAVEVTQSLKDGKSGIEFVPQYKELGFRSQVAGTLKLKVEELVDRRLMRFMGDGADMVAPSGEGALRCMRLALEGFPGAAKRNMPVNYINTHGTATPVGDITELDAIRAVFGDKLPTVSSTKSLTGHSQGATGAHEAIYSLLMMKEDFVAASANIENLDPGAEGYPIARQRIDNAGLQTVMSNSFGFGGTNACLLFSRYDH